MTFRIDVVISGVVINAGSPVGAVSGGVAPASGASPVVSADGVAIVTTQPNTTCLYSATGQVRLADWTDVFGSPALAGATNLYLANAPGLITATEPGIVPASPEYLLKQVIGNTTNDLQVLNVEIYAGFSL